MHRSSRLVLLFVCLLAAIAPSASAQAPAQAAKPDPTTRDVLLKHWTAIGDKVVQLPAGLPEDKYEFRPAAGVRSFGDQLRHVAFWNGFVAKTARGEKADGKANELPKAQYATKAAVVQALKESLAEATAQLKAGPATPTA